MPTHRVEPPGQVRTKIVATLGPASRDPAVMRNLVEAGVDVFRLNFSHGSHDEHTATLQAIRSLSESLGRPLAVLQDLGGPKIRLGAIPGGEVTCHLGEEFTLVTDRSGDDPHELTCTYRDLPRDLTADDVVLFADGAVTMRVISAGDGKVHLVVELPGRLRSGQGLNLPGANLRIEALTEKDLADLDWTAKNPVEFIGLSFVRRAADVIRLRGELEARDCRARIVAKIEKPQAVADLDLILAATDAVMVARGDLGVEMDVARVPAIQKRIIAACRRARLPVITATQMLNSMETSGRPTRAEASDVFNAVLDGTDAVMLSGETAIGEFPVEAVATMSQIASEAEAFQAELPDPRREPSTRVGWILPITEGVVEAASFACRRLGAALLVVVTHSGRTALALSKQRHPTPTLAVTDDAELARRMSLYWGVTPFYKEDLGDSPRILSLALEWARKRDLVSPGDRVVLVQGTVAGSPVRNALLVHEVE